MQEIFSLFKINNDKNLQFSPSEYSRFKFGDHSIGKKYGNELAQCFIEEYLKFQDIGTKYIAYSSPYQFIPTATKSMFDEFVKHVNIWLYKKGWDILEIGRIYRNNTYSQDYGELSAAERLELIGNDTFYLDKTRTTGRTLLLIDDIRITGSHEAVVKSTLKKHIINNNSVFIYFAEIVNPEINPTFENYLNYFQIKSPEDVLLLIHSRKFTYNTRVIKYILALEPTSFSIFISQLSNNQLIEIFYLAISNNYHSIKNYIHNLKEIQTLVSL